MAEEGKAREWYSVTVVADKLAEDAVETALAILDSLGTEIDTLGRMGESTVRVVGYFDTRPDESTVRKTLDSAFAVHGVDPGLVRGLQFESVAEKDWLSEWKKHWTPTVAGKFVIAPPWDQTNPNDKVLITIEPAMAFGTGTHETTRLCLEFISQYYLPEMSFLDVGTGTGILAIAAAKLHGDACTGRLLACDTDEHSVAVAAQNAELNEASSIELKTGSLTEATAKFDFVCANMTIDIIKPMLPLLVAKTARKLIISGILAEQEKEIRTALSGEGIKEAEVLREGEWIALAVKP